MYILLNANMLTTTIGDIKYSVKLDNQKVN